MCKCFEDETISRLSGGGSSGIIAHVLEIKHDAILAIGASNKCTIFINFELTSVYFCH